MPKSVFTDAYGTLLTVLVAARKERGITQVELAKLLGKPQPWVSNYERRIRRIDVLEFIAVSRALGAKPDKLFQKILDDLPEHFEV